MTNLLVLFGVFTSLLTVEGVSVPDPIATILPVVDEVQFKKYKAQVCDSVPSFKGEAVKETTFYDEITESEIFEMAFLNMANGFLFDSVSNMQEDMGWKKRVMDLIALITKQSCDNAIVPEMYVNVAKNLFLYYLFKKAKSPPLPNKVKDTLTYGGKNGSSKAYKEATWMEMISMLEQCAEHVTPIPFSQTCDIASQVMMPTGDMVSTVYAEDRLDVEKKREGQEFVDEVVDGIWFMFSTTYARCYTMFYPREDWVVQFFDHFRQDFLNPFSNRWRNPGPMAEYFPIVFGPFDFRRAKLNMRYCNGAAYQFEGIQERQLVRPVFVTVDGVQMLNFKTGAMIMEPIIYLPTKR